MSEPKPIGELIDELLADLFELRSRQRVLDSFRTGWITADMAEAVLTSFDEVGP